MEPNHTDFGLLTRVHTPGCMRSNKESPNLSPCCLWPMRESLTKQYTSKCAMLVALAPESELQGADACNRATCCVREVWEDPSAGGPECDT